MSVGDERGGGTVIARGIRQFEPAAGGRAGRVVGIDVAPGQRAMQSYHRLARVDGHIAQMVGHFAKQRPTLFDTQWKPCDVVSAHLWKRALLLDEVVLVAFGRRRDL